MAKKKKNKVYTFGDVVTIRLSPDSNCTQEVLDWINKEGRSKSKDFIEAIKLQIALEQRMSDKSIREIALDQTKQEIKKGKGKLQDQDKNLLKDYKADKVYEVEEVVSEALQAPEEVINNDDSNIDQEETSVEDEIFGNQKEETTKPKGNPALRAMMSIQRNRR